MKMNIKIFFVIAVACMVQVVNAKDINIQTQLTSDTIKLINRRDDFGSLMVLSDMEYFLEKTDPKILKCYKKFFQFYKDFTKTYAQECAKLATECQKRFTETFKNVDKLEKLLNGLSKLMTEYPQKMLKLVESHQTDEAIDYMHDSWFKLEFTEATILGTLKGLKRNNPIMATKGDKTTMKYKKIRDEAKNKATQLSDKFENCMEIPTNVLM